MKSWLWLIRLIVACMTANCTPAVADCVVLIHGLARSSASMDRIAAAMAQEGYDVVNVDYKSRARAIEELATNAVESGIGQCPDDASKINFVTHSLGGILVRYYMAGHVLDRLGRVVMLAPPNNGSEIVDTYDWIPGFTLITGPAGKQLGTGPTSLPRSLGPVDFPLGIVAGTRSRSPIFSLSLPNPDDGRVSLASAKVRGMADFVTVPYSHNGIVRSSGVIREIVHFLEHGRFCDSCPESDAP